MNKPFYKIFILICLAASIMACNNSSNNNNEEKNNLDDELEKPIEPQNAIADSSEKDAPTLVDLTPSNFVTQLKNGKALNSFFSNNWTFIYHEDNRCDGSTDGQKEQLKSSQIDEVINLNVKNDGDGWACDKKEPKSFELDFNLKEKVSQWDRFEIPNTENQKANVVYIHGSGESDYVVLHYNSENKIVKLEYRSEDPG